MTDHEKIKIFVNINIPALLRSSYKCVNKVKKLRDDFYGLYCRICPDYLNDVAIDQLQRDINEWVEVFLKCFPTDNVTPYIHVAFACHVCEFLKKYNNINFFNQQGLQKLIDTSTKMYFRGTNMGGSDALKQLMLRRSRITILENEGCTHEKRDIYIVVTVKVKVIQF